MLELDEPRKLAYKEFLTAHTRLVEVIDAELSEARLIPLVWYDVLVTLEYAPDHTLRMSELADKVLLSRSGLTRLVERLESQGLVSRQSCPKDRRGTHAVLTPAGKAKREEAWPLYSSLIQELFGSQMSDTDVQTVTTVMLRVTDAIKNFRLIK